MFGIVSLLLILHYGTFYQCYIIGMYIGMYVGMYGMYRYVCIYTYVVETFRLRLNELLNYLFVY